MKTSMQLIAALGFAFITVAAGCGDDGDGEGSASGGGGASGDGGGSGSSTSEASTTSTSTTSTSTTGTGAGGSTGGSDVGNPCSVGSQCESDVCIPKPGCGGPNCGYCSKACANEDECPVGWSCDTYCKQ